MRHLDADLPLIASRRDFLQAISVAATTAMLSEGQLALAAPRASALTANQSDSATDAQRMRDLAAFTALTIDTPNPVPFGAEIVDSKSGKRLMRATNAVGPEYDPSAHAEVYTIRLACKSLNSYSLRGYTLYTTCEPCPMCMACSLWARLDRVVYGATIADAARFGHQIQIPASEVAKRTDMTCIVDGPVERDACFALFTNPKMQETFKRWNAEKS
jgi:tRNA(Arg) A34 adenosine deaminase TadA